MRELRDSDTRHERSIFVVTVLLFVFRTTAVQVQATAAVVYVDFTVVLRTIRERRAAWS